MKKEARVYELDVSKNIGGHYLAEKYSNFIFIYFFDNFKL